MSLQRLKRNLRHLLPPPLTFRQNHQFRKWPYRSKWSRERKKARALSPEKKWRRFFFYPETHFAIHNAAACEEVDAFMCDRCISVSFHRGAFWKCSVLLCSKKLWGFKRIGSTLRSLVFEGLYCTAVIPFLSISSVVSHIRFVGSIYMDCQITT